MSKNPKLVSTQDFEDVIAVVTKYVEGLRTGRPARLAEAFHKDAVMYGFSAGELIGGSIKNLYDIIEKVGGAPDVTTRLDVLAITPTTAVVRVDMEKAALGAQYQDFLTLLKLEDGWKVIAKAYHQFGD
ncbi:nuclear transport factor 2 family protein [Pendulispora albinea]|uniref:Nuclear transport factor 2 family protein n=1 Tax=Pendulispora albinea TaxID=2741071 RepID=A0ABZ2M7J6_9BACT